MVNVHRALLTPASTCTWMLGSFNPVGATCCCRYVSVLVELTRMKGTKHGQMIANQMLDVAIRVQAIRPFTVTQMVRSMYEGCHGGFGYRRILARAATFVFRCACDAMWVSRA